MAPADGGGAAVPRGVRAYAIGDIHGRIDLLERLLALIERDARGFSGAGRLIFLGDYVDRGPDSAAVIERLAHGPLPALEPLFLKGNHEDMLCRFLESPDIGPGWFINGGLATMKSYARLAGDPWQTGGGPAAVGRRFAGQLPPGHRAFFDGLRHFHRLGDYLFVHAGIRPNVAIEQQSPYDLMWIREEFLDHQASFGPVVVHGHTIRGAPEVKFNRIGIDTGAWLSGELTCLVLEGSERRFLST